MRLANDVLKKGKDQTDTSTWKHKGDCGVGVKGTMGPQEFGGSNVERNQKKREKFV